jgi:uncharacterized protein YhfF/catechol 2,3-dioxygenase-like lactoylglutathione lyase family enzyme
MTLFNHATVGARDLAEAQAFYDTCLPELGLQRAYCDLAEGWLAYGPAGKDVLRGQGFWVCRPLDGQPASAGNGVTIALAAPSRFAVRAFHAAALKAGGTCEGPPGLRAYHRDYYAAYLRDPSGNKLCAVINRPGEPWDDLNHFFFGSGPEMADRLAALVVAGVKRATVGSGDEPAESAPGERHVVVDGARRPVCVIETLTYERRRLADIDAAFAAEEGEGDGSLLYWRVAHRRWFEQVDHGGFSLDRLIWAETFRMVELIDPDCAAAAPAHLKAERAEAAAYIAAHGRPEDHEWKT